MIRIDWSPAVNRICDSLGIDRPTPEYRFDKTRRWRFDFAWLLADELSSVALEIEGGIWTGGAHTRGKHFESDCEKYNAAAALGWRVLRVTPGMLKDGRAAKAIESVLGG